MGQPLRPHIAKAMLEAAMPQPSPKAQAIDFVLAIKKLRMPCVEPYWRWTVILACAIACERIESIK